MDLLSQSVIALSTWAWLELHSTSLTMLIATLLALAVLSIVAAAVLATVVRRLAAASIPATEREPFFRLAVPRATTRRPDGGRGPRAPGVVLGRLALR
ncbi:hypothetical protein [Microbacterium elymi]|uniref:Uncharacterized protein n=1 Tax=Microbacterium elymi TaxID=2909587 RepID=A0ABY5NLN3_9MICO|nr:MULTISPECIES: hypothetical protein [Microbacterium]UUT36029.1 hypothetical protein L2X98_23280 [Microbacterium elymi]